MWKRRQVLKEQQEAAAGAAHENVLTNAMYDAHDPATAAGDPSSAPPAASAAVLVQEDTTDGNNHYDMPAPGARRSSDPPLRNNHYDVGVPQQDGNASGRGSAGAEYAEIDSTATPQPAGVLPLYAEAQNRYASQSTARGAQVPNTYNTLAARGPPAGGPEYATAEYATCTAADPATAAAAAGNYAESNPEYSQFGTWDAAQPAPVGSSATPAAAASPPAMVMPLFGQGKRGPTLRAAKQRRGSHEAAVQPPATTKASSHQSGDDAFDEDAFC